MACSGSVSQLCKVLDSSLVTGVSYTFSLPAHREIKSVKWQATFQNLVDALSRTSNAHGAKLHLLIQEEYPPNALRTTIRQLASATCGVTARSATLFGISKREHGGNSNLRVEESIGIPLAALSSSSLIIQPSYPLQDLAFSQRLLALPNLTTLIFDHVYKPLDLTAAHIPCVTFLDLGDHGTIDRPPDKLWRLRLPAVTCQSSASEPA